MKVGILTFHFASNYGAVFQALGLQNALLDLGHEPVIINYIPVYMRERVSPFAGWGLRSGSRFVRKFRHRLLECFRRREFAKFRQQELILSPKLESERELRAFCMELDAIIVGSDQVWNLSWQKEYDSTYFLGFLPEAEGPIKIAYGACFGQPEQPPSTLGQAMHHVKRFSSVGMRNTFGLEILRAEGISASRIVDPAFFLPPVLSKRDGKGSVVIYAVNDSTSEVCGTIGTEMARVFSAPILHIASEADIRINHDGVQHLASASPKRWLDEISRSVFVCSESFHGVVFSMTNNVPFVAPTSGARAHRLRDLLSHYGLSYRLIDSGERASEKAIATWDDAFQSLLQGDINYSREFLGEALSR